MRFLSGFAACLIVLAAAVAGLIYSGLYNVAATEPHSAPVRWALHETMHYSVKARAADIAAPDLTPAMVQAGMPHFQEMCVACHGGPQIERGEIGQGLNPTPPNLSHAAEHWAPRELFWIVKHGVKMTGMPAFGPTHDDDAIWAIVALLQQLPIMSMAEFKAMGSAPTAGEHGHGAGSGNAHQH